MKLTGPNIRIMLLLVFLVLTNTALFEVDEETLCQCLEELVSGIGFFPAHLELDESDSQAVELRSTFYPSLRWFVVDEGDPVIVKTVSTPSPASGATSTIKVTSVDLYTWNIRKEPEKETSIRIGGTEDGGNSVSRALGITAKAPRLLGPQLLAVTTRSLQDRSISYSVEGQRNENADWRFSVTQPEGDGSSASNILADYAYVKIDHCLLNGQSDPPLLDYCDGQTVFIKARLREHQFNEALLDGGILCGRFFPGEGICRGVATFQVLAERNTRVLSLPVQLEFFYRIPPNP